MAETWHDFFFANPEPRFESRPLIPFYHVLIVEVCYIAFAKKIGPALMKNRAPFENLKWAMVAYNFFMVGANVFFHYHSFYWLNYGRTLWDFDFPGKADVSPQTLSRLNLMYFYYLTKYADWIDTIFFVMKKKYSHISGLHVYHHSVVPMFGWLAVYVGLVNAPATALFVYLNSLAHVVMYSYYGLAALGPGLQKYLWWKKYVTQLQIIQFVILGIYATVASLNVRGYPPIVVYLCWSQPMVFLYLFINFYLRSYKKKDTKKSGAHKKSDEIANGKTDANGHVNPAKNDGFFTQYDDLVKEMDEK